MKQTGATTWFVSQRERRLWGWVAAVVVTIYATLGITHQVAAALRHRGLIDAAFAFAMLLIMFSVAGLALRSRPQRPEIGIMLGVVATYLLAFIRMTLPEERTHLIEYSVVAALIYEALLERITHARPVPFAPLIAIFATVLLGTIDELIQAILPARVFDPRDILFNLIAATMAVCANVALRQARQRRFGQAG